MISLNPPLPSPTYDARSSDGRNHKAVGFIGLNGGSSTAEIDLGE